MKVSLPIAFPIVAAVAYNVIHFVNADLVKVSVSSDIVL